MKNMNGMNNTEGMRQNDEPRDYVKEARICARIALRTIFHASGHPRILEMYNRLYASCVVVDRVDLKQTIADNYDCVSVAAVAILEYAHLPLDGIIGQGKRRDGSTYPITVRLNAIKAVNRYVMAHRGTHGRFKTHYIEDIRHAGEGWIIDNRLHIDDMQTLLDINDIIDELMLSDAQQNIVKLRLKGYSQKEIAQKMHTLEMSISRQMKHIRNTFAAWMDANK